MILKLNRTSHCTMCAEDTRASWDRRNQMRVRLGGPSRIAICLTHDVAGPVSAYPPGIRAVAGLED